MSKTAINKSLSIAMGATFAATVTAIPMANANTNPFGIQNLQNGYTQIASNNEGKCGANKMKTGKCGANFMMKKAKAEQESKCGANKMKKMEQEGKCGANKMKKMEQEGKCGANKMKKMEH